MRGTVTNISVSRDEHEVNTLGGRPYMVSGGPTRVTITIEATVSDADEVINAIRHGNRDVVLESCSPPFAPAKPRLTPIPKPINGHNHDKPLTATEQW